MQGLTFCAIVLALNAIAFVFLATNIGRFTDWLVGVPRITFSGDLARPAVPLGHSNSVASVILLLLPFTMARFFQKGSLISRTMCCVLSLLLVLGLVFSLSRTGLAVGVLALVSSVVLFSKNTAKVLFVRIVPLLVFIVMIALALVISFGSFDFERYLNKGYFEQESNSRRIASFLTALDVLKDYPLWGISPNSLYVREELREDDLDVAIGEDTTGKVIYYNGKESALNPHNLVMTVLAELGFLGGIPFLGILFWIVRLHWKCYKLLTVKGVQYEATMVLSLLVGIVVFLIAALADAGLVCYSRIAFTTWAILGISCRYAISAVAAKCPNS